VHLLNPDTEVRPGAIDALARFLAGNPQAGIAGSGLENADGSDWPIAFGFPIIISEFCDALQVGPASRLFGRWAVARKMPPKSGEVDCVSGNSMMIRSEVFEAIGGLDQNYFLYFEEPDLCYRAKGAGFSTWYVPPSRIMHIGGQSTELMQPGSRPKRLPKYWFGSRRRYFTTRYGSLAAMVIDIAVIAAYPLGSLKRRLVGKEHGGIPHYLGDFCRHTVLRPGSRETASAPLRTFRHGTPRNPQ